MSELLTLLDKGGYSAVVESGGELRYFTQRGVADLYHLYINEPYALQGARVADKVVGKGAAALMVAGGVKSLSTHTISRGGYELLTSHGVEVECGEMVDHIINRSGDGWCPVESLCRETDDVETIIEKIKKIIEKQK
ncbi:MAG: DUF1893 domain-containing protein [Rikenellaceae bacterium]